MSDTTSTGHADDCLPGDECMECGGCDCGFNESLCIQGCVTYNEAEQRRYEYGFDDEL